MPDATKPPTAAPQVPRSRLSTRLETIREADEAEAQADSELVYRRGRQDYARPGGGRRVRLRWRRRAMFCVIATDALLGLLSAVAAVLLSTGLTPTSVWTSLGSAVVGWPLVLTIAGVYQTRSIGHGSVEFRRVATATVALLAVLSTAVLAMGSTTGTGPMRALALIAVPSAGVLSLAAHIGARIVLWGMRRRGRCRYQVVVVGTERSVAELVRATRRDQAAGLSVVGACVNRSSDASVRPPENRSAPPPEELRRAGEGKPAKGRRTARPGRGSGARKQRRDQESEGQGRGGVEGVPVLGSPRDAAAAARRLHADTVLITAWSDVSQDDLRRLSWQLEGSGVELLVAPRLSGVAVPRLHIRTVDGSPLVHVDEQEFTGLRRVAKAALDYGLAGLLILVSSPLLAGLALAVKLTSPGPVLFRQERVGRYGEKFTMHKFRSMYLDAEEQRATLTEIEAGGDGVDRGPLFKMRDDPRVTPVGRFIRRYSLDELPQLLDVMTGRMSLVGPRPPLEVEVAQYEHDVRRRLRVKPGMTGLWQVSGRSDLSWEDAVRLDLHYVENWSLTADLAIMFRTVAAVIARDGAY